MVGINDIGVYIPSKRISNYERKEKFKINDSFIEKKIGIKSVSIKDDDEDTSDLCFCAMKALEEKVNLNRKEIDIIVVVTQNPDRNIPHTSAMVHGKLDLDEKCACFDISLGCSGFVYALSVIKAFMQDQQMKCGILFTADPYSKIVDPDDKNTALLFGDAATATLITPEPALELGQFRFGTAGKEHANLICNEGILHMNGRGVFNFAAKYIPEDITLLLEKNKMDIAEVDKFLFHQGSKVVVEKIRTKLEIEPAKVPFEIYEYGNTVSSSVPILLEREIRGSAKYIAISGFGVGLSWASGILKRTP